MATTAPGLQTVKPRRVPLRAEAFVDVGDDDPTEYPDYEPIMRDPTESKIATKLEAVLTRYQAARGILCYVGSDNAIYWVRGDNQQCVSPDVYILLGIAPDAHPKEFVGSKEEGCWKTWIHQAVPCFAVEVKAWGNPRKDELQSPRRHDALGTKELIVFDPFSHRRRKGRKRFVVYRRDAAGKLVSVLETNDDRVFSEQIDAYLVVQGEREKSLLRVGLGPNGERLLPFESELVDLEAYKASEATLRAEHEARMRQEETRAREEAARRVEEEARRAEAEARRADAEARERQKASQVADDALRVAEKVMRFANEEAQRADEEAQRADEEAQRADEEAQRADEEAQRADAEAQRADAEAQRAEVEARARQDAARVAEDAIRVAQEALRHADEKDRRIAELEAELARKQAPTRGRAKPSQRK